MRVVVTGATGFIGRHLTSMLGPIHEIYAVHRDNEDMPVQAVSVKLDLSKSFDVRLLPERVDAVIHLAQSQHYREFPIGIADVFAVNVASTVSLLQYAVGAGARQFILASTGSVYAPGLHQMSENAVTAPSSFYSASKLAAEYLAHPFSDRLAINCLRLFFPYGPGQSGRLVSDLIDRVANGRAVTLQGSTDGLLFNPTYVDDIVAVIHLALKDAWSGTFNIAAPRTLSIRQAATEIGDALGREPRFESVGGEAPQSLLPDLSRLGDRFDLDRFITFREGIGRTISVSRVG
jgi:UDP-glucose 4-epimerase